MIVTGDTRGGLNSLERLCKEHGTKILEVRRGPVRFIAKVWGEIPIEELNRLDLCGTHSITLSN